MPNGPVLNKSYVTAPSTVLPPVPPLTPNVSAPPVGLLATKMPLVAVKTSNVAVSISIGPVTAFSVGGGGGSFPKISSGTETKSSGVRVSDSCSAGALSL